MLSLGPYLPYADFLHATCVRLFGMVHGFPPERVGELVQATYYQHQRYNPDTYCDVCGYTGDFTFVELRFVDTFREGNTLVLIVCPDADACMMRAAVRSAHEPTHPR